MNSKRILKAAVVLTIAAFFMGCGNNTKEVKDLEALEARRDSLTVEIAHDVIITYTDSAILRARISAPLMKRFPDKEDPKLEMPNGVKANFFNPIGEIQSSLTAKYAMHFEKDDRIEIRI